MSRTYRRKKGHSRFWIKEDYATYAFINQKGKFKNKKAIIKHFESDNFNPYGTGLSTLKEYSKKIRRANEREQLGKIMKSENDIHNYDDSFEDSHLRRIIWHIL